MKKLLSVILALSLSLTAVPLGLAFAEGTADEGLLLWYEFNDGAKDSSGNGLEGELKNGASVSDGSVYFDGADDYVQMPSGVVSECEDITVSVYVKPEITGANQFTWTFGNSNTTGYIFLGTCNSSSKMKFELTPKDYQAANGANTISNMEQIPYGEWHHVAVTIKDKLATVYKDGEAVGSMTVNMTPKDLGKTAQNYLAKSQYNDPYFKGYISDFRVYSTALSQDRIKEIGKECAAEVEVPVIGYANRITEDIELPTVTENTGAAISWVSSDPDVISQTGQVTRPSYGEGRKNVTLTATIGSGAGEKTKEYNLTVLPETSDEEYGYLLAYFTGNSGNQERLSYALSANGYDFYALNSSSPIFKAAGGTGHLRDPYIFKGEDGKYYCLATDMNTYNGSQWSNQSTIFTWESTDLIHWTNERIIDFKQFEGFEECNRAWAPQAIWCPEKNQYMIYLALKCGNGLTYMYRCYTDDFTECTAPERMFDFGNHAIDGDIIQGSDGMYYMYFKNDNTSAISIVSAETLSGEWTDINPNTGEVYPDLPKEGMNVEGSAAYKLIGENRWNNLVDCYNNGRFMCLESDDLINYSVLTYGADAASADYYLNMYDYGATPRHGSVITVSKAEYEALEKAFSGEREEEHDEPILYYSFDNEDAADESGNGNDGVLSGGSFGEGVDGGKALVLNGSGDYVNLPAGIGSKLYDVTVAAWVKIDDTSKTNQRIVDIGSGTNEYMYFTPNFNGGSKFSISTGGTGSQSQSCSDTTAVQGEWTHMAFTLKMNGTNERGLYTALIYVNGKAVEIQNMGSDRYYDNINLAPHSLGYTLENYIGKSQFSADSYFGGMIDDFRIYDRALTAQEIGDLAKADGTTVVGVGGENVKGYNSIIDEENKTVQLAVTPGHITEIEPVFELTRSDTAVEPVGVQDFTNPVKYTFTGPDGAVDTWTVSAVEWGNSVLGEFGCFGDPNIAVLDGKYYIYPTTDGTSGWVGTHFKAFSSTDLLHWTDEGTILDFSDVEWTGGRRAWAPTICEYGGKYYYYYSGTEYNYYETGSDGGRAIGVAVSDNPNGPFEDIGRPLVLPGTVGGQMIDPQVFIDDDGQAYLYWGNGNNSNLNVAKLGEDMISIDGAITQISGVQDFTEAIFVFKRDGKYYFTWSQGSAESAAYHVSYAVADSPYGPVTYKGVILSQGNTNDGRIQSTAHQSVINIPGTDDWYICYHRFNIPTTVAIGGGRYAGSHREVAVDKLEFDSNGDIKVVSATLEGVTEPVHFGNYTSAAVEDYSDLKEGGSFTANVTVQNNDGDEDVSVIFAMYDKEGNLLSVKVRDVHVDKFSSANISENLTLKTDGSGTTLKIMTWNGMDTMEPVSSIIER